MRFAWLFLLSLAIGLVPESAGAAPQKWALLVGIGDYRYADKLAAPANDVSLMKNLLTTRFAFPESNVATLIDEQATKQGIADAFRSHLSQADEDDIVVFYFSGHGSNVPDKDRRGEADGLDETLVTYDSGRTRRNPNRDLTDDELATLLGELASRHVAIILDSCHSGTATRQLARRRWIAGDDRGAKAIPGLEPTPDGGGRPSPAERNQAPGMFVVQDGTVLIAAASSDQAAYERRYDGVDVGSMTYHLARILKDAPPGTSYREVLYALRDSVRTDFPSQRPEGSGTLLDNAVFGSSVTAASWIPVLEDAAPAIARVKQGKVMGMTRGTRLEVVRGSQTGEPQRVAQLRVTDVRLVESYAAIESGSVRLGDRARIVQQTYPPFVLDVYTEGKRSVIGKIKRELKDRATVSFVSQPENSGLVVLVERDRIEGRAPDGKLRFGPYATDETGIAYAVDAIRKWSAWHAVRSLKNATSGLAISFELGDDAEADGATPVFGLDEKFHIVLENRSALPLFCTILNLTDRGKISVVFPVAGAHDLSLAPGAKVRYPVVTSLEPGIERVTDVLRLVATTEPVDFRAVAQGAVARSTTRQIDLTPLQSLLLGSLEGTRTEVDSVETGDWLTSEIVFETRR